jgi:hypothetical protein
MNRNILVIAAAIAVNFAISAPAGATPADERAREAAAESPQALRSFVQRTRMIYALNIQDFATASDEASIPTEATPLPAFEKIDGKQKELADFREQIYRDMLHE